jgi:hypothetical protein
LVPSHREIATKAESIWRKRGCPPACDEEIWLEAERQLCGRPDAAQRKRDRVALADPRFSFNRDRGDLMGELDNRFPGATGRETTSL